MAEFVIRRALGQMNPGAVEIGRAFGDPGLDQHFRHLDPVGLDRNPGLDGADAGEHLAADLPGIMPAAPGVRDFGAGQGFAKGSGHGADHPRIMLRYSRQRKPLQTGAFAAITMAMRTQSNIICCISG